MTHLCGAPARPWQTVVIAIRRTTNSLQRGSVERVLVGHVQFQTFGRLAGIANGPHAFVDLTQGVFDIWRDAIVFKSDVAEDTVMEAEFLREQTDDFMVSLRFKQRIHDLFAPLERPVGRGNRAICLELRRRW